MKEVARDTVVSLQMKNQVNKKGSFVRACACACEYPVIFCEGKDGGRYFT